MTNKLFKRVSALLLCLALVLSLCPAAFAVEQAREDGTIEVAFFTGDTKETPTTEYTYTYSPATIQKGTGSSWDRGCHYLETNAVAAGDSVTVNGIDNIPAGTYRIDLVYKQGGNRATVKCSLDDMVFDAQVDINGTAAPAVLLNHADFVNTQPADPGNPLVRLYAYPLADSVEISGNETTRHSFTMEAVAGGTINVYGFLLTPVGQPILKVDTEEVAIDLLDAAPVKVSATVKEGYGNLKWASADETVATVAGGTITAVGVGETVVSATVTKNDDANTTYTLEIPVVVTESAAITLDYSAVTINLAASGTARVNATVDSRFSGLTFKSSDETVATVAADGTITALAEGTATITASVTNGTVTRTAQLTVTVVKEVQLPIEYSDNSQVVLTASASRQYVKLARGATVEQLLSDISTDVSVLAADGSQKTAGALTSSDRLVVKKDGSSATYSLIVMGDKTSTDIVAVKTDDTEFGMQGSNVGAISPEGVTLIDGKVRRLWVDDAKSSAAAVEVNKSTYTGTVGRVRALRSCAEIITQFESANGTAQTYKIVDANGSTKTNAYPVTGDKLIVTAADGVTTREYPITVETAAVSGQLILSRDSMTVGTVNTLVLDYYAGQRSPEAVVEINLPMAVKAEDITINLIGRGDVAFENFSDDRGALDENGYFENEQMHKLIGRFGDLWEYETLGTVELTNGGTTLKFTGLDLRANNGADLRITIKNVKFDQKGDYDFSASFTTAGADVDATLSGLSSLGQGPETAAITVVSQISDLTRLPYDPALADPNYTYSEALGGITGLSYLDYSEMGELYTSAYLAWTPAAGVETVALYQAEGNVAQGGVVTAGQWVKVADIPNTGSYTVENLTANRYYQFKLVAAGAQNGDSNIVEHYSGKLEATLFGAQVEGNATTNKNAINAAIDWLSSIGGGTLNFKGNGNNDNPSDYPVGTIYLKDDVYLYVEEGARLHAANAAMDWPESGWFHYRDYDSNGSDDGAFSTSENFLSKQDDGHSYFQNAMFFGRRVNNVKIIGQGRLDGDDVIKKGNRVLEGGTNKIDKMITLKLCTNVEIGGINTHDDLKYDLSKADEFNTPNARPYYAKAGDDLSNMLKIDRNGHFALLSTATDNINLHDVFVCMYDQDESRDAFDFMANRDVYVTNIFSMASSDDIVKLGSECSMGFTRPAWNYMIRNIIGDSYCNNFQLGSETADDIQNVYVDNLVVLGSNKAGFSISTNDGALVKNINLNTGKTGPVFEDSCYFQKINTPIFISISHRGRIIGAENYKTPAGKRAIRNVRIGHVDQVTVSNLKIVESYGGSVWDHGSGLITYDPNKSRDEYRDDEYTPVVVGYQMPAGVTAEDMPDGRNIGYITNITFDNIDLTVKGFNQNGNYKFSDTERTCNELDVGQFNSRNMGVRPSYAFYVRHAQNVTFQNMRVDFEGTNGGTDDRYPIVFDDVKTATMNNVTMAKGSGVNGLIQMRDSDNVSMIDCVYFDKLGDGTLVAVENASGLTGGIGKENWGVYPALMSMNAIALKVNTNSAYSSMIKAIGETVEVYKGITVEQLQEALVSANPMNIQLTVMDSLGRTKIGNAKISDTDTLVVTTDNENAIATRVDFPLVIASWPGLVRYFEGNDPNPTLRTEPEIAYTSSSDNGSERYLEYTAENEGDSFLIDVYIPADGYYSIDMVIKKGTRATVQNYMDDKAVGEAVDLGAAEGLTDVSRELNCGKTDKFFLKPITGEIYLTQGTHTFKSTVTVPSADGGVVLHSLRLTSLGGSEPDYILGDMNKDGKVDVADMLALKTAIMSPDAPTGEELTLGDITGDGKLNVVDILRLKQLILG